MYEKYNFDGDFQDKILACVVAHPAKFMVYAGILSSTFFTGVQRIAVSRAILAFWRNYKSFPDWNSLSQVIFEAIAQTVEQKEEENISKYLRSLREVNTSNVDYVASRVIAFARERSIYLAFEKGYSFFNESKVPEGGYSKLFDDANKVGLNLESDSYMISDDQKDLDKIFAKLTKADYGIRTGFAELDEIWKMGWGPGWLIAILAPPKGFKTAFCINLAMNMIGHQIGRPVFYYPCEITQELAALRCLQNASEQEADVLWQNPTKFKEKTYEKMRDHIRGGNGRLMIKGFSSRTASIANEIRTDIGIRCSEYGIDRPRAIFIDFAETVKPSTESKTRSEHRAAGEIYVEARALAAEFQCPVILPDRCNKDTVNRRVPSMTSFQGAFEKAGHVDAAIGLCADEAEQIEHRIRYFIFLNRHGHAKQHIQGRVQPEFMKLTMDGRIPYNPEEDEDQEKYAGGGRHRRQSKKRPPIDEIQN